MISHAGKYLAAALANLIMRTAPRAKLGTMAPPIPAPSARRTSSATASLLMPDVPTTNLTPWAMAVETFSYAARATVKSTSTSDRSPSTSPQDQ